jgi:pentose-5-phosphate-3-epimerase
MTLITKVQPSIIAVDRQQFQTRMGWFLTGFKYCHLDAMIPPYVENNSLNSRDLGGVLDECETEVRFGLHIMGEHPINFLDVFFPKDLLDRTDTVIVHYEIDGKELRDSARRIKEMGKRFGLAIKVETSVEQVFRDFSEFLEYVDEVVVMTVDIGAYGAKFQNDPLVKLNQLRRAGFKGTLGIDGGIKPETIGYVAPVYPHYVVVGSHLQKAFDKLGAAKYLQERLDTGN